MTSAAATGPALLAEYAPGVAFGPRQLLEYEFVWLLRGSVRWTIHDRGELSSEEHILRPGQLALSRQHAVDSYRWDEQRTTVHGYVHFLLEASDRPPPEVPSVREMSEVPLFAPICDYLVELGRYASDEDARRRTDTLVATLLDLYTGGRLADPVSALPDQLRDVQAHVRQRWHRDGLRILSTEDLAAAAGISTGHLYRLFRRHLGRGPAEALELVRLSRAAILLHRSNATLTEIARTCGFANPYHLSRRFSAAYGMPPGRFRRTLASDPMAPVRSAGLQELAYALIEG